MAENAGGTWLISPVKSARTSAISSADGSRSEVRTTCPSASSVSVSTPKRTEKRYAFSPSTAKGTVFVASPNAIGRIPVANGSSVPVMSGLLRLEQAPHRADSLRRRHAERFVEHHPAVDRIAFLAANHDQAAPAEASRTGRMCFSLSGPAPLVPVVQTPRGREHFAPKDPRMRCLGSRKTARRVSRNAVTVHQHLADALPLHVIFDLACGEAQASLVTPESDGVSQKFALPLISCRRPCRRNAQSAIRKRSTIIQGSRMAAAPKCLASSFTVVVEDEDGNERRDVRGQQHPKREP